MPVFQHKSMTREIIGAGFAVHSFLGMGFKEVIYQRALAWEFEQRKIPFEREIEQDIYYRTCVEPIGKRRADFVVKGVILVELKALSEIEDAHINQVLNYLRVYRMKVGLILNFGAQALEIKRLIM